MKQSPKTAGWLITALAAVSLAACATPGSGLTGPDLASALKTGLDRQVIRPAAPADRAPAVSLPGELASRIYQERYIKTMTEKKRNKDNEEKSSEAFR